MMKNAHCLLLCDTQGHIASVLMYVVLRGCSLEVEVEVDAASHHKYRPRRKGKFFFLRIKDVVKYDGVQMGVFRTPDV